ncbi:MAG: hypothetical protein M3R04_00590 [bacterium]|nr:hypothetical protein [bacterium]
MARNFDDFKVRIENEFMQHPVVTDNKYCAWFRKGDMSVEHVTHFVQQFSVFSHLFLIAALKKVINADSLEGYRESKEILMNELGVIYNNKNKARTLSNPDQDASLAAANDTDPSVVSTEGTVDGGIYRHQAGHFEWLLRIGETLGLGFNDIGKRRHGTKTTLHFCDQLSDLYGHEDYNVGNGAGFSIENWAAAGFWQDLIAGLEVVKQRDLPKLQLAFFTFHDKIEGQHKEHVWDELRECFTSDEFNEDTFIENGVKMLDACKVFWDGLYDDAVKAGEVKEGVATA